MAFSSLGFSEMGSGSAYASQRLYGYISSADALATIVASGYFNDYITNLKVADVMFIQGSDDYGLYKVTSVTTNVTVEAFEVADIEDGAILNAQVGAAAAIAWSKMAALTEGNLLLGSAANVATVTDFSADAQIGIGDGTTFNSVAVSGDVTIDNTGAVTIAAGAVEKSMLAATVRPSHMIVYAGQPTTVGGAAAEAITVTGALNTDLAFVQMVDDGTNNVTIVDAVVTADTLTVTFSGDPGNDAVINYQLVRATS